MLGNRAPVRRKDGPRKSTRRPSHADIQNHWGWRTDCACRPSAMRQLPGCPVSSSQASSPGLLFQQAAATNWRKS